MCAIEEVDEEADVVVLDLLKLEDFVDVCAAKRELVRLATLAALDVLFDVTVLATVVANLRPARVLLELILVFFAVVMVAVVLVAKMVVLKVVLFLAVDELEVVNVLLAPVVPPPTVEEVVNCCQHA